MRSSAARVGRIGGFYLALLGAWYVLARAEVWPSYTFPSPGGVWEALRANIDNGMLVDGLQATMRRMALGFSVSIVVGLTAGVAMGMFRTVDETLGSLVVGLQSLPSITWFPLALLWFGLNEKAVIFVVLMGSVGSIAISARSGVRGIPPLLLTAARMFGARRLQLYRSVVLPAMLPAMVQGLKLGWSFAWRSLLAAELLFVSASLGFLLNAGRDLNDVSLIVAVMLVIVAIGLTIDRLVFARMESWVAQRWGLHA
jgi:NitT/TauT family transport system permease protein